MHTRLSSGTARRRTGRFLRFSGPFGDSGVPGYHPATTRDLGNG